MWVGVCVHALFRPTAINCACAYGAVHKLPHGIREEEGRGGAEQLGQFVMWRRC